MKLAEALSRRAALIENVEQIKLRLKDCVKIQEGDVPVETAEQVISELDRTLSELQQIIYRINLTNTMTRTEDGRTLTSLLAERDTLGLRVRTLGESLKILTAREVRYNRSEIRIVRTVDATEFRHLHDRSATQLRELDLRIQSLGWTTELIDA